MDFAGNLPGLRGRFLTGRKRSNQSQNPEVISNPPPPHGQHGAGRAGMSATEADKHERTPQPDTPPQGMMDNRNNRSPGQTRVIGWWEACAAPREAEILRVCSESVDIGRYHDSCGRLVTHFPGSAIGLRIADNNPRRSPCPRVTDFGRFQLPRHAGLIPRGARRKFNGVLKKIRRYDRQDEKPGRKGKGPG
jgi:hypothetical protein